MKHLHSGKTAVMYILKHLGAVPEEDSCIQKDLEKRHIEPWLRGIIRSQGSVMGETAYDRILDFATEWECKDGKALFIGVSTFTTSDRGKYKSNIVAPQENIVSFILQQIDIHGKGNNLSEIIKRQSLLLENYVAPFYDGPLGIDMLVTSERNIHPCVEINLRDTMGRVAIDIQQRIISEDATELEIGFLRRLYVRRDILPYAPFVNPTRYRKQLIMKINIVGRGNVATHLSLALENKAEVIRVNPVLLKNIHLMPTSRL